MWSETVKFDILQEHQYLNVCIWSKFQDKNEKDALLGYVRHISLASFGIFYCSLLLDYVNTRCASVVCLYYSFCVSLHLFADKHTLDGYCLAVSGFVVKET